MTQNVPDSIYATPNITPYFDELTDDNIRQITEDYTSCFRHYTFKLGPQKQCWEVLQYQPPCRIRIRHNTKPISQTYQPFTRNVKGLIMFNHTHYQTIYLIRSICMIFYPLGLPDYILLWIIDFLPHMTKVTHPDKFHLITNVKKSCHRIYQQRASRLSESI